MLVQISNGYKQYATTEVFNKINFMIKSKERVGLVGRNGSGKSTLLKIIAGEEELDAGDIFYRQGIKVGYLSQVTLVNEEHTVLEEVMSVFEELKEIEERIKKVAQALETNADDRDLLKDYAQLYDRFEILGGHDYEHEMLHVLNRFGFDDDMIHQNISTLSGGERTKVAFVKLLLHKPDLLLLDEPTNHLDLSTIEWLESYLKSYHSAMIIISHDRTFLDNLVDIIWEIELGSIKQYHGNYSKYEVLKQEYLSRQEVLFENQQREIKRLEEFIEKNRAKASTAKSAQSKIKYLERMSRVELDQVDDSSFKAKFEPAIRGGDKVLEVSQLTVGYDEPLATIDLTVNRGDRIGIIGDNGTGKSTFIQTIMDFIPEISGEYLWGYNIERGYFDQRLAQLNNSNTVLDEIWDEYPHLTETEVRTLLGNFLFKAEDVFKQVNVLSGGEKVRLSLLKIMLTKSNCLILDEPTNHLDIIGKDALSNALSDYTGTIIFVSHDRDFINKMADQILVLDKEEVSLFHGNYDEYKEKNQPVDQELEKKESSSLKKEKTKLSNNKQQMLEKELSDLEKEKEQLEADLFKEEVYSDFKKVAQIEERLKEIKVGLDEILVKLLE